MIKVLLVDDEALVRSGLRMLLAQEPDIDVVGEVDDGAGVPGAVRQLAPDVVLMDVRMPRIDGIAATAQLIARQDSPKVLVVTTFENDEYVYDALRAGAAGFLLKRAAPEEIVQAVRTVAAGESLLFPAALRQLVQSYGGSRSPALTTRLTQREQEVLRAMARGLSNAEIAGELVVSLETIKSHVAAVLAKLGARDRTQAVILAYESGFVAPG